MECQWTAGHKCTRIMEKVDNDTLIASECIFMPNGSTMEERAKTTHKKPGDVNYQWFFEGILFLVTKKISRITPIKPR